MADRGLGVVETGVRAFGRKVRGDRFEYPRGGNHSVTFIDSLSYITDGDDDYSFDIETLPPDRLNDALSKEASSLEYNDAVRVSTRHTKRKKAKTRFRLKRFELHPDMEVVRRYFRLNGKRVYEVHSFDIPNGYNAVPIIEVLKYETNKDDDMMYIIRTFSLDRTIYVVALTDFAKKNSELIFRITFLRWKEGLNVGIRVTNFRAGHHVGNAEQGHDFFKGDKRFLFNPTMYITDTSKYPPELFDSNTTLEGAIGRQSVAGRNLDSLWDLTGVVTGVAQAAIDRRPQSIVAGVTQAVGSLVSAIKGVKGDKRDDDLSMELEANETGDPLRNQHVSVKITRGNKYSLAEATLWEFDFPKVAQSVPI